MASKGQPLKAFVSYATADKHAAADVAEALRKHFGIAAFMTHEDIQVGDDWKERILHELATCDIFVPLLSRAFHDSDWASQEIGHIASRLDAVVVIPISLDGTVSYGFINFLQSRRVESKADLSLEFFLEPLLRRARSRILPWVIEELRASSDYRHSDSLMRALAPFFSDLRADEAMAVAGASIINDEIWSAPECRKIHLPRFLEIQGAILSEEMHRALRYQIRRNDWHHRPEKT